MKRFRTVLMSGLALALAPEHLKHQPRKLRPK